MNKLLVGHPEQSEGSQGFFSLRPQNDIETLPRSHRNNSRWKFLALAVFIFAGALSVRLFHLGANSFWIDEMFHVEAAKSLMAKGIPELPSGRIYSRALPFTYTVALSFKLFGVNEVCARLPGVFFGLLSVAAVFWITRKWFGRNAALIASFLVAFAPLCLKLSRECRMYSLFQLLYLVLCDSAYSFLDHSRISLSKRAGLGMLSLFLFAFSLRIHALTFFFLPSFFVFLLVMALLDETKLPKPFILSPDAVLVLVSAAVGFLLFFLFPAYAQRWWTMATYAPPWASGQNSRLYYKWLLEDWYPVLFYGSPLAFIFLFLKDARKAVYVACQFAVPFFLLSFVFQWKEERYLLAFLTFFLIGISPFLASLFNFITRLDIRPFWSFALSGFLFLSLSSPWLAKSLQSVRTVMRPDFRSAGKVFVPRIGAGDLIVTTHPLEMRYYGFGGMNLAKLNNFHEEEQKIYFYRPDIDFHSGYPLLRNFVDLKKAAAADSHQRVWFFLNGFEFADARAVPVTIRNFLIQDAEWYQKDGSPGVFTDFSMFQNESEEQRRKIFIATVPAAKISAAELHGGAV